MHIAPEDIVRSGPNQYICEHGILKNISPFLTGFNHPVIITGYQSSQAFHSYAETIPSHCKVIQHDGYSSIEAVQSIGSQIPNADVIIGIGGGIILDTAKEIADFLDVEIITIPSVAGTCAAATPLSVIYDPNGKFQKVSYHKRSSTLTIIDPAFLITSPTNYLKSGIGDTLAKWYEAEAIIRHANDERADSLLVQAGLNQSIYLRDILLENGELAVESSEQQHVTVAFTKVIEAIIVLAGTVGGFAGKYGRMSGAHAIHNGLSFLDETHTILHGQKVAYGILVQLALEAREQEILDILPFYKKLGFPINFHNLGIYSNIEQKKEMIAAHAIKPEESLQLIGDYTIRDVVSAMDFLENLST